MRKKTHDRNQGVGPERPVEGSPGSPPCPAGRRQRQSQRGQVGRLQDVCIQGAGVVRSLLSIVGGGSGFWCRHARSSEVSTPHYNKQKVSKPKNQQLFLELPEKQGQRSKCCPPNWRDSWVQRITTYSRKRCWNTDA